MARFLHAYPGYTVETALTMPWRRFLALLRAIDTLQAEDDLRALQVAATAAHPGEKGEGYRALVKALQARLGIRRTATRQASEVIPGVTPLTGIEAEPGSIRAEMQRQKEAWERMLAERRANK